MKNNLIKGSLYIMLSGFFFALMSVFVRFAGSLPSHQKAFFRNGVALLVVSIYLWRTHTSIRCKKENVGLILARSLFGTAGIISNYYAIDHINLGDANILNKLSTFVAVICSAIFLKEKFKLFHLAVVFFAFVGCIFVVQPTMEFSRMLPALVGVTSGITAGFALTCVRELGRREEKSLLIVFYFSVCSTLITLPFFVLNYEPMRLSQFLLMVAAGICAGGGQLCLTTAYYHASAKDISAFDYSQILFSALFGFLFFNQVPNKYSIIGYVLIIAMGLALFAYNKWWHHKDTVYKSE